MLFPSLLILASAVFVESRNVHEIRHFHDHFHRRQNSDSLNLNPKAFQKGSTVDGSLSEGATPDQVVSETSNNNFLNFCSGKELTNGLQITTGSCNGIVMGDIPAKANMVSTMITFPLDGSATIESNKSFNITVEVINLVPGFFTNAVATYYSGPQFLQDGKVVGHTHVTVQDMGDSLNPKTPMDPTKFAFFKGINDPGNGKGTLQAVVTGGLPQGNYRVCTMSSAANHQAVLMPVAQRGTPDDCSKFKVIGTGTTKNDAANDGVKGLAAAALAASAVASGPGFVVPPASTTGSGIKSDDGSGAISTVSGNTTSSTVQATATSLANNTISSTALASNTISSTLIATSAPFSNSTATTRKGNGGGKGKTTRPAKPTKTRGGNPGNGGNNGGGKGETTSVAKPTKIQSVDPGKGGNNGGAASTTSLISTTTTAVAKPTKGQGGKPDKGTVHPHKPTKKQIITIIKTFFVFRKSHGAACPAVQKSGNKWNVLDELFDDLAQAASAACGRQFSACIQFNGPNFSGEECISQKDDCAAVATTQRATASTPAVITASVTIPVEAAQPTDIPGSVVAIQTIAPPSTTAVGGGGNPAPVTETVLQPIASSGFPVPSLVPSNAPFSNSTGTGLHRRFR